MNDDLFDTTPDDRPKLSSPENLARIAFAILDPLYRDSYGNHLRLERIRLYETPNCWADARRDDPV